MCLFLQKGIMNGSLLANKYMPNQKNKGGCIVNVASIFGFDALPYVPVYNCTKHAVVGFTKSFGVEFHAFSVKTIHILNINNSI